MKSESEPNLSAHFLIACVNNDDRAIRIANGKATKEDLGGLFHWINPCSDNVLFINDEPERRTQGITAIKMSRGDWFFAMMPHKDLMELMREHGVATYGLPEQKTITQKTQYSKLER